MDAISHFLEADHQRCDDLFEAAEAAVAEADWPLAADRFLAFTGALRRHFGMEEAVLFPAFEARTGNNQGPSRVMRMEHEQMRELLEEMAEALSHHDANRYAGLSETLLVLMQQHNLKEEQILYPMCDRLLADEGASLVEHMAEHGP